MVTGGRLEVAARGQADTPRAELGGAGRLPTTARSSAVVRLFIFVAYQLGQPLYNEVCVPLALRDPVWPMLSDNASNHDDRHANSSGTFELS